MPNANQRPTHLRIVTEDEESDAVETAIGAAIENDAVADAAKAMATRALTAAIAACKAGTCTAEQRQLVTDMAREAINRTGKSFEDLQADNRTIPIPLPPAGYPVLDVKISDLAGAAKPLVSIPQAAADSVGTGARILGWIGENPRLTLGLVAAGVGVWVFGPALAPVVIAFARR